MQEDAYRAVDLALQTYLGAAAAMRPAGACRAKESCIDSRSRAGKISPLLADDLCTFGAQADID